jgi:adenylate kinase
VELLFEALLRPEYESGVIVDGFPRTRTQAECIKLLYDTMIALRRKHEGYEAACAHRPATFRLAVTLCCVFRTENFHRFRRPIYHITVLFVEEAESIRRQLERGKFALHHNQIMAQTGVNAIRFVRGRCRGRR